MTDVIVIGGGPAGCSAAVTLRMRSMDVAVITLDDGALTKAHAIENYPGMPGKTGREIIDSMRAHAEKMGVRFVRALAEQVMPMGDSVSVLAANEIYEASAVILALGAGRVKLLPGEEENLGCGVSYCATCDGMFYKGKDVLVVASSHDAVEEANYLSKLANVSYVSEKKHDAAGLDASVSVLPDRPLSIEKREGKMLLTTDAGERAADGIFVMRPQVALTRLLPDLETEDGAVKADRTMATNIPGVFVAGDMAGQPLQLAKAVGEGNVAALSAAAYVTRNRKETR